MPGFQMRQQAPQAQAYVPQPAQWQTPKKTRAVSADPIARFVLPSPETLGVTVRLNPPQPISTQASVDWNQIQSRMERLRVLRYEKDRLPAGGVRVRMLLPTSDPAQGQPVEAHAETEAAAVVMALNAAETWAQKR